MILSNLDDVYTFINNEIDMCNEYLEYLVENPPEDVDTLICKSETEGRLLAYTNIKEKLIKTV